MPYHNTYSGSPSTTPSAEQDAEQNGTNMVQSETNGQGQIAPPGYHYMPDGTLMSDVEHAELYGEVKVISFTLDTGNLPASGEKRQFQITGSNNSAFSLEIKNEDNYYYNFKTNLFQAAKTRLDNELVKKGYIGNITFPTVTDADKYNIYLFAEQGTKHEHHHEVRFEDNNIDINSSIGSDSLLLEKVIYQTLDIDIILSSITPNNVTALSGHTPTTQTITTKIGKSVGKTAFSIPITSGSGKAFKIDRDPISEDALVWVTRNIGAAPVDIPGEDIYPTISDTDTVDGDFSVGTSTKIVMDNNVADNMAVGDKITIETTALTDTIDGNVTSGQKIVMANNVATKMAVGDTVTGLSGQSDTTVVSVTHLNPDDDNPKEFQIDLILSGDVLARDGDTLTFTPKCNTSLTTVAELNPDGDNVKEFSMSQAIGFRDGSTLSFSNRKNYRWPLDNIYGLSPGMTPIAGTGNTTSGVKISSYEDALTVNEGTENEYKIVKYKVDATDALGVLPTFTRNSTTNLQEKVQTGNICFSAQQPFALAADAIKIYSHGVQSIKALTGWEIKLTDLKATLTAVTTTTTSAVINSATVPVASGDGIMDDVSTVSGIGIDPSVVDPTVTNIGSYSGTTATLTLGAVQTLESGATLSFSGAGETITITGNIEIINTNETGNIAAGWNKYIYFDLEKFITATVET